MPGDDSLSSVRERVWQHRPRGTIVDYLRLARFDHSTKHILIVPGVILAYLLRGNTTPFLGRNIALGLGTALCLASANYVINEWLDREFDRHHPTKSRRIAVTRELRPAIVAAAWCCFVVIGLGSAALASKAMFSIGVCFVLQGIAYNVKPFRTKDRRYVDVVSESINNPIRLSIGWAMVDPSTLPPSSLILCYWSGGAFLMAAKRLSEYREIVASHGKAVLTRYRASFAGYSDSSLTVSCFVYGLLSNFFLGIFLIKYRIEYLLIFPAIIIIFSYYLAMAMKPASAAQSPENLFRDKTLLLLIAILVSLFFIATKFDISWLHILTEQRYIMI